MAGFLSRPLGVPRIHTPVLGILDLSGAMASEEVSTDRSRLAPLFESVLESRERPPQCDVLLAYCHLSESGAVSGSMSGLRELIRDSKAKVVVFALPNAAHSYLAASSTPCPYGAANLVMTLDRKGEAFAQFFARLFAAMKHGTSMPVAWVQLAPQMPGGIHPESPDTIFACEIGQLAFG